MKITEDIINKLVRKAQQARENAYCPYSDFPVGAAAYFENGEIVPGCNVENASYGGTLCAERVAIPSGIAQGFGKPLAVAVTSKLDTFVKPCGICRQFMIEFGPELVIICCTKKGDYELKKMKELLPEAFGPYSLE